MMFVRGHCGGIGFLKYSYLRLPVYDYVNMMKQRRFSYKVNGKEETELTYRVVMIKNNRGRVSWKNGTGNYVTAGQILCDIISKNNEVHSIKAPISGLIANRFVDEGSGVTENALICMLKVCAKPTPSDQDRKSYILERRLYSRESSEFDTEESEESGDLEQIFGEKKRLSAKSFIQPIAKEDDYEENLDDETIESGIRAADFPERVLDKRRKDEFDKYTPQDIKDEMKTEQIEKDLSAIQQTDRSSNEFYQQLLDDNFLFINRQQLQIDYRGERSKKFLHISTDIDLTSALQFVLNEGERNNIKFELKYLILLGCIRAFRELPFLINSKDKSINITMGIIAGGKLWFPMITNLEKDNFSNLKDKLSKIKGNLIDRTEVNPQTDKRTDNESLAITNEWDYGCMSGPSCLYISQHASLSLNAVTMKPRVLGDRVNYLPIMSSTLTFNNEKIDGQDALLFLNKVKESIEQLQYSTP